MFVILTLSKCWYLYRWESIWQVRSGVRCNTVAWEGRVSSGLDYVSITFITRSGTVNSTSLIINNTNTVNQCKKQEVLTANNHNNNNKTFLIPHHLTTHPITHCSVSSISVQVLRVTCSECWLSKFQEFLSHDLRSQISESGVSSVLKRFPSQHSSTITSYSQTPWASRTRALAASRTPITLTLSSNTCSLLTVSRRWAWQ